MAVREITMESLKSAGNELADAADKLRRLLTSGKVMCLGEEVDVADALQELEIATNNWDRTLHREDGDTAMQTMMAATFSAPPGAQGVWLRRDGTAEYVTSAEMSRRKHRQSEGLCPYCGGPDTRVNPCKCGADAARGGGA